MPGPELIGTFKILSRYQGTFHGSSENVFEHFQLLTVMMANFHMLYITFGRALKDDDDGAGRLFLAGLMIGSVMVGGLFMTSNLKVLISSYY